MRTLLPTGSIGSRVARYGSWTFLIIAIFWVANLLDKPIQEKKIWTAMPGLKIKAEQIWGGEKLRVDEINNLATETILKKGLKPGDPLPPNLFYQEGDSLWGAFDKTDRVQIVTRYEITNKRLASTAVTLIGVENSVPELGKPYAACYILVNPDLFENGYATHPDTSGARELLKRAEADVEAKRKKTGAPDPLMP